MTARQCNDAITAARLSYCQRLQRVTSFNAHWFVHEAFCDAEHFPGHGGGKQAHLNIFGHKLEYVINRGVEAAQVHLVRLVKHEHLDIGDAENATVNVAADTSGRTDNNVDAFFQLEDLIALIGASDADQALRLHEAAELQDHLFDLLRQLAGGSEDEGLAGAVFDVDALQNTDCDSCSLAASAVNLTNSVVAPDEGKEALLLQSGRLLKTEIINAAEEVLVELKGVEGLECFRPVALDIRSFRGSVALTVKRFGHFESNIRGSRVQLLFVPLLSLRNPGGTMHFAACRVACRRANAAKL